MASIRGDLVLLYFPRLKLADGRLERLTLVPRQLRRFRLNRVTHQDAQWLCHRLNREGERFGTRVRLDAEDHLVVEWG